MKCSKKLWGEVGMDLEPWLSGSVEELWVAQAQPVENDVHRFFFMVELHLSSIDEGSCLRRYHHTFENVL